MYIYHFMESSCRSPVDLSICMRREWQTVSSVTASSSTPPGQSSRSKSYLLSECLYLICFKSAFYIFVVIIIIVIGIMIVIITIIIIKRTVIYLLMQTNM